MKNRIYQGAILIITLFGFIACEEDFDSPPVNQVDKDHILNISDIYNIYQDSSDNYKFEEEYFLYASVIMDDASGNIYKEAYVQDSTGGINLYDLGSPGALATGEYVRINLKGASIKNYRGKMEIVFDDIYEVEKHLIVQEERAGLEPALTTISGIKSGKYDCELIRLDNVQFAGDELNKTYADKGGGSAQNRTLVNCSGESVEVRSSDYADFAADTLPDGNGSITGVITKFEEYNGTTTWQLLVRNTDEVKLDSSRCETKIN